MIRLSRNSARYLRVCFFLAAYLSAGCFGPAFAQSNEASAASECGGGTTVDTLGPEKAKLARTFLSELKTAVELDQRSKVANMIRFPVPVGTPKRRLQIKDREEFLYNYEPIVTSKVKATLANEVSSKCLFANWQGFMVGDGEVWFDEISPGTLKVITFNIDEDFSPRHPAKSAAN